VKKKGGEKKKNKKKKKEKTRAKLARVAGTTGSSTQWGR
jgi:hypothetical protein